MPYSNYREEVFNVLLAILLHERGVVTAPEQSFRQALKERRHVPDVLVVYRGLRTVIEGKVDDKPGADENALEQARDRVASGIAHIGIALLYSGTIREISSFSDLSGFLTSCTFKLPVCSEAGETGWTEGGIDYLTDMLRRTFDQLVQEDIVTKAVETLNAGVEKFAHSAFGNPAAVQKAAEILGIRELPKISQNKHEIEEE